MITWVDWGIWLVYFAVIYTALWFYRQTKTNDDTYQWFLKGFLIKVFGGVAFALVSINYYGGDTLLYHLGSKTMSNILVTTPKLYFELLFTPNNLPTEFSNIANQISYSRTPEEWFMVKIASIFTFISFNSYLVTTLFMSFISFWGGWKLFLVFSDILKRNRQLIFVIVFLLPTILFWGTGLLKDTITLALINYIIYFIYQIFENKTTKVIYLIGLVISSLVIYGLKSYIILGFMPSAFFIVYLYSKDKIKSNFIRKIIGPVILIIVLVVSAVGIKSLSEKTVYSVDNIQTHVRGFHTWHTTTGGSAYNLGEIEYTFKGIVTKIPSALNVTFFRPYIWEARNFTSLIGALESSLILIFFIYLTIKIKFRYYNYLKQNKFLLGLLVFVLLFGFAVGFTSYNFGALARYKMPVYQIFVFMILYIYSCKKTYKTYTV